MNENTNLFIHIILIFQGHTFDIFSFSKYHPLATFFYSGFKLLLWNTSKDHLGFLNHLDICFKFLATQLQHEVRAVHGMPHHFNVVALKPFLHKNRYMWSSIVLLENPPLKKFWSFPPDIKVFPVPSCNTPYLSIFFGGGGRQIY